MGSQSREHKLLYIDSFATQALGLAKTFLKTLPSLGCFNFGSFPLGSNDFGTEVTTALSVSSAGMSTKLLYFDATTGTEVHYACLDAARATLLVDFVVSLGVPIPSSILNMMTGIFKLFHVDGVVVLSNSNVLTST